MTDDSFFRIKFSFLCKLSCFEVRWICNQVLRIWCMKITHWRRIRSMMNRINSNDYVDSQHHHQPLNSNKRDASQCRRTHTSHRSPKVILDNVSTFFQPTVQTLHNHTRPDKKVPKRATRISSEEFWLATDCLHTTLQYSIDNVQQFSSWPPNLTFRNDCFHNPSLSLDVQAQESKLPVQIVSDVSLFDFKSISRILICLFTSNRQC